MEQNFDINDHEMKSRYFQTTTTIAAAAAAATRNKKLLATAKLQIPTRGGLLLGPI